jgi:hypothetical protein
MNDEWDEWISGLSVVMGVQIAAALMMMAMISAIGCGNIIGACAAACATFLLFTFGGVLLAVFCLSRDGI